MMNSLSRKVAVMIALCCGAAFQTLQAQERLSVLSYNVLNYPNPDYVDYRADTLKKIIDYYKPDLFLMQELKHPSGMDSILQVAFNTTDEDHYLSGTWQWQVSAPWSSWKLQQNVIYNANRLTLIDEGYVQTGTRDHNVFKFMVNDPNLPSHQDTTFLYAINIHLKASQGASNVAERLQMAEILTGYLETLEENAAVMLGGDFNVYTSSEPAYQHLLSGSEFVLVDPIDTPGNWHNSAALSHVHTQSTRTFQVNGDGAGGGLDDRFDFVLLSENMMDPNHRIHYVEGTYNNMGYTGGCLDQNLLNCTQTDVPPHVKHALYQMSDHLPVTLELDVVFPAPTHTIQSQEERTIFAGANAVYDRLDLSINADHATGHAFRIIDVRGNVVHAGVLSDGQRFQLDVSSLASGWYLLSVPSLDMKPYRFVKVR